VFVPEHLPWIGVSTIPKHAVKFTRSHSILLICRHWT